MYGVCKITRDADEAGGNTPLLGPGYGVFP
jgi:hypothetical protein